MRRGLSQILRFILGTVTLLICGKLYRKFKNCMKLVHGLAFTFTRRHNYLLRARTSTIFRNAQSQRYVYFTIFMALWRGPCDRALAPQCPLFMKLLAQRRRIYDLRGKRSPREFLAWPTWEIISLHKLEHNVASKRNFTWQADTLTLSQGNSHSLLIVFLLIFLERWS